MYNFVRNLRYTIYSLSNRSMKSELINIVYYHCVVRLY